MTGLVDSKGRPLSSVQNKKVAPPPLGEKFGSLAAASDIELMRLPGGALLQFDLNRLTLADYRSMLDHYQVNNSLSILTFMLHQLEWHVECDNKKMEPFYNEQLASIWSQLIRAKSKSFWAGFSPNVIQWDNDVQGRRIVFDKIKDQFPEDCLVNWKEVNGYAPPGKTPPKLRIFDGMKITGAPYPVPVSNTYWYPLLMSENNHYGKKLLRSAFQPWFFSQLLHLFANRYFERFGEPVPVGRAPYEDTVDVNGKQVKGNVLMGNILQQIRNRSVAVLPNDKSIGSDTNPDFDYQIEYLESQMRGADFERYMTRLDEEISLSLFTPILMMRTADVGSYNLGTQHTQVYMWMLNALVGDWKFYIDNYLLRRLRDYNDPAGENGAMPRFKPAKLGKVHEELLRAMIQEGLKRGDFKAVPRELGELAGLTLEELDTVTAPPEGGTGEDEQEPGEGTEGGGVPTDTARRHASRKVANEIVSRVGAQIRKGFATETFGTLGFQPSLGYRRRMEEALKEDGFADPADAADMLYDIMDNWLTRTTGYGMEEYGTPETYTEMFAQKLRNEIGALR